MKQYEINKTAILEFYPKGVCSSASLELQDSNGATFLAETVALTGSASATGSANQYAESITLSNVTNFTASRPYWVSTTANGRGYEENCLDICTGSNAFYFGDKRLRFALVNGLVRDHRIYFSFTGSNAVRRGCSAIWRYVLGGETFTEYQSIDFVRKPFKIAINESDIEKACATFGLNAGETSIYLKNYPEQAISDICQNLRGHNIFPDQVVEKDLLKSAAIYRILQFRHFSNIEMAEKYEALYLESMAHFYSSKAWITEEVETAANASETVNRELPPSYMMVG